MRRVYLAAPFLIACAIILAAGPFGQLGKNSSTDTPVHVTNVFFDGINAGDYRQTCSVWQAARSKMSACESGLARQLGMSALMGEWGGYRVVPHSEKVWVQPYRGRTVEMATVDVIYAPTGGQKLVAHLRRVHGHWLIWYVL